MVKINELYVTNMFHVQRTGTGVHGSVYLGRERTEVRSQVTSVAPYVSLFPVFLIFVHESIQGFSKLGTWGLKKEPKKNHLP